MDFWVDFENVGNLLLGEGVFFVVGFDVGQKRAIDWGAVYVPQNFYGFI